MQIEICLELVFLIKEEENITNKKRKRQDSKPINRQEKILRGKENAKVYKQQ